MRRLGASGAYGQARESAGGAWAGGAWAGGDETGEGWRVGDDVGERWGLGAERDIRRVRQWRGHDGRDATGATAGAWRER